MGKGPWGIPYAGIFWSLGRRTHDDIRVISRCLRVGFRNPEKLMEQMLIELLGRFYTAMRCHRCQEFLRLSMISPPVMCTLSEGFSICREDF